MSNLTLPRRSFLKGLVAFTIIPRHVLPVRLVSFEPRIPIGTVIGHVSGTSDLVMVRLGDLPMHFNCRCTINQLQLVASLVEQNLVTSYDE